MTSLDIVSIGNVAENNSTPPYYFYKTAEALGYKVGAIDSIPVDYQKKRLLWNILRLLSGKGKGGFQYSKKGCELLEETIVKQLDNEAVLTFSQHLLAESSLLINRELYVYVDATLAGFNKGIGLDFNVPTDLKQFAIEREKMVYTRANLIFTRSAWAKASMIDDHGIEKSKIHVVYPGANLGDIMGYQSPKKEQLVLGFVAKDWERKGFPYLIDLAENLQNKGLPTIIKAIGYLPKEFANHPQVQYLGFVNKKNESDKFIEELQQCHFGTLFSDKESLGISSLEFLRCGVPIIGFNHQGIADTLHPKASISLEFNESVTSAANKIYQSFCNDYDRLRKGAEHISPFLTWQRAVNEIFSLIEGVDIDLFSIKNCRLNYEK